MPLSRANFDWIRHFVEQRTGNVVDEDKMYLVEARLAAIAESTGKRSVEALIESMRGAADPPLERRVFEAMLTHESSFFRDPHYIEELATEILPHLIRQRQAQRQLHIWCAACAAGQEPYSLAMLIREQFGLLSDWEVRIVATDLSRPMLDQARLGRYSAVELQRGVSPARQTRFFQQEGTRFVADPVLRQMIEFREMNLVTDPPPLPRFDLILLRNVLIYMTAQTSREILTTAHRALARDGGLMVGSTETLIPQPEQFTRDPTRRTGCFQPIYHGR